MRGKFERRSSIDATRVEQASRPSHVSVLHAQGSVRAASYFC